MDKGARFYNCDFQVHSPRDTQFSGAEYVSDEERKLYATNFIKACRDKKIDAVAITDHHDLAFYKFIKDASENELDSEGNPVLASNRIIIFPGLELTLALPCQAIVIFDSHLPLNQELITSIYAKLNINDQSPANSSKISNVSRLPFNEINDIYESLEEIPQLKNRFIVFPNIKDGGGDTILRDGFHTKFANSRFVGGYLDRGLYETHKTKQGWLNVINGEVEAYGKRKIGVFQTSDCRTDTFEHLGISSTWVKWSEPTAEGLRQACLANESRISQEKPVLPSIFIDKLFIRNTTFLKTIEITLNEQFNVLIGGRGTGKSSVLMYLEWVLGKDFEKPKAELLNEFIESTVDENTGEIEVSIIKNGVRHIIKRSKNEYKVKIGANEFQDTDSDNIQDIIKCKSFSQKELSKHNKNREKQLLDILKYSIKDKIEQLNRKLQDNAQLIKESINNYIIYLDKVRKKNNLSNQIDSLTAEITELNNTLENLSEDDTKIIGAKSKYNYESELLEKYKSIYDDISTSLQELKEKDYEIHDFS
jgi:type III restriction enzyme